MRRHILLLLLCSFVFVKGFTQSDKRGIAPFKIRLVNGAGFTYQQLPKNMEVRLIYFSPTCDHCKAFAAAMLRRQKALKNKLIIMISFEDIREVQQFDKEFKLSSHPNIKIGSEGYTFVVQRYYNIEHFPFVAEYDKKGALMKVLPSAWTPEQMAAAL